MSESVTFKRTLLAMSISASLNNYINPLSKETRENIQRHFQEQSLINEVERVEAY